MVQVRVARGGSGMDAEEIVLKIILQQGRRNEEDRIAQEFKKMVRKLNRRRECRGGKKWVIFP